LRGAATNPGGTLAGGVFGGGTNATLGNFNARGDFDVQVVWEWQNLGFGNKAKVQERRRRKPNRPAGTISPARPNRRGSCPGQVQVESARARVGWRRVNSKNALERPTKTWKPCRQTKAAGNLILLVIRPQEVIASLQALAQAYQDYYGAIADYNRSQFRLYHALGHPPVRLPTAIRIRARP